MKTLLTIIAATAALAASNLVPIADAAIVRHPPRGAFQALSPKSQDFSPNSQDLGRGEGGVSFGTGEDSRDTLSGGPSGGLIDRN